MTKTIEANGLTFGYLEAGEAGDPLVLCVHGFPDTADTWFFGVAQALAEAGYHVVAPYTRGYAPTTIPSNGRFGAVSLGQDVVGLLEALEAEGACVMGHDWGAFATYAALGLDASRIEAAVTIDIPHPNALKPSLSALWGTRHFIAFQFPKMARRWITRDGFANVDGLYRRWSPTWKRTPEDTAAVKACFAEEGVAEAALAYYQEFRKDQFGARAREVQALLKKPITVPMLSFGGTVGPVGGRADFERARRFCENDYRVVMADGAGHWIHREQPELFIEETLSFLADHPWES